MTSYFLHDGLNHSGPFSLQDLQEKTITADTPVWTEGLGDWAMAKELPELATQFNLVPTPPPFQRLRKPTVAVVPAFNIMPQAVASYTEYKPVKQVPENREPSQQVTVVTEYDQDRYQMEMENYFTETGTRNRNPLWIAAAVIVLGSLTIWLVKLMSA